MDLIKKINAIVNKYVRYFEHEPKTKIIILELVNEIKFEVEKSKKNE